MTFHCIGQMPDFANSELDCLLRMNKWPLVDTCMILLGINPRLTVLDFQEDPARGQKKVKIVTLFLLGFEWQWTGHGWHHVLPDGTEVPQPRHFGSALGDIEMLEMRLNDLICLASDYGLGKEAIPVSTAISYGEAADVDIPWTAYAKERNLYVRSHEDWRPGAFRNIPTGYPELLRVLIQMWLSLYHLALAPSVKDHRGRCIQWMKRNAPHLFQQGTRLGKTAERIISASRPKSKMVDKEALDPRIAPRPLYDEATPLVNHVEPYRNPDHPYFPTVIELLIQIHEELYMNREPNLKKRGHTQYIESELKALGLNLSGPLKELIVKVLNPNKKGGAPKSR